MKNDGQSAPRSELVVLENPVDSLYVRIKIHLLTSFVRRCHMHGRVKRRTVEPLHKHYTWNLHVL